MKKDNHSIIPKYGLSGAAWAQTLLKWNMVILFIFISSFSVSAQEMLFDGGWKFAFGNASSPEKDFGRGTEYFNYFTKAASIHNTGPDEYVVDDEEIAAMEEEECIEEPTPDGGLDLDKPIPEDYDDDTPIPESIMDEPIPGK